MRPTTPILSLALLGLAQLGSAAIAPENVINGKVLRYFYRTQALCTNRWGLSGAGRLSLVRNSAGQVYCECVRNNTPEDAQLGDVVESVCPSAPEDDRQAYCLTTYQETIVGTGQTPIKSKCDTCSRTAGSPGARSVPCQETSVDGKVVSSGACTSRGMSLYRRSNGACECSSSSISGASKCPLPKAGGYATCRHISEQFYKNDPPAGQAPGSSSARAVSITWNAPNSKCEMRCNTGLHLSPSEKPVTCCKVGFRANSAGLCSKSTDGKQ